MRGKLSVRSVEPDEAVPSLREPETRVVAKLASGGPFPRWEPFAIVLSETDDDTVAVALPTKEHFTITSEDSIEVLTVGEVEEATNRSLLHEAVMRLEGKGREVVAYASSVRQLLERGAMW